MADEEDMFAVFQTSASDTLDKTPTTKPKAPAKASTKRSFLASGEDEASAKQAKLAQSTEAASSSSAGANTFEKLIGDDFFADKEEGEGDTQLGFDEKEIPRMQIYCVETNEPGCTHEVAVPPGMNFVPLAVVPSGKAAKKYKFELDSFQKQAILCLENSQSVLVSAHTSAGKTAIAEYAVALSLNSKQRVLYTTPIKALSNQKYRELADEFVDVGLMTGDVTINATASCIVMTTEILRSMLYRGSEVMREVAWVIFDEIHYMRDTERGVVWEESIILLPDNIHFVFLSATIPNARQFAEWIAHLHKQPCHVVYTDKRPVPLEHEIFSAGDRRRYLVLDAKGRFDTENFQRAMASLSDENGEAFGEGGSGARRRRPVGGKADTAIVELIKELHATDQTPAIVFSFSRKDCERLAMATNAEMRFTNKDEQKLITQVFENALDTLSEEDKQLESLVEIKPMLKRGIGVHHSGLLPLLKETIEILFSEGLLKVLFATETFSMGLNMPARTVLFASARKFDGKDYRFITSGEYIQMSGRAGRRGIDEKGTTIIVIDERMTPNVCTQIIKGKADPLNSAFHLTYNMILNLMRVEDINPEYMLEKSFFQFQTYATLPGLIEKVQKVNEEYASMQIERESELQSFHKLRSRLNNLRDDARRIIRKPIYLLPFLQPGRLVRLMDGTTDFSWAVVLDTKKKDAVSTFSGPSDRKSNAEGEDDSAPSAPLNADPYAVDCLIYVTKRSAKQKRVSSVQPCSFSDKSGGELQAVAVRLCMIYDISTFRLALPSDLRDADSRKRVLLMLNELFAKVGGEQKVPTLDWRNDLQIRDTEFLALLDRIDSVDAILRKHPLYDAPEQARLYEVFKMKLRKQEELGSLKRELQKKRSLIQMRELKNRKRVLRRLGYCNQSDVIEIKGRVACEISSADELVLTELIFNGVFTELTAAQSAAVLSCFVFQDKANEFPKLGEELIGPLRTLRETARRIARVSRECKLELEEEEYVDSFRPHLMDVVFAWCNGASFRQVCSSTDVFEGSIVRAMRRLEETLRQTCYAAKAIGNTDLENKFADAVAKIKRDIIFAASLYL